MTSTARKTRVLVVGAGRRAKETLLPAVYCSSDHIDLVGVCARSRRVIELLGGRFVTTTRLVSDIDMSQVDAVVVAVSIDQVPNLLAELSRRVARPTLMLDTPGLAPQHLGAAGLFKRFPAVLACEDTFALPPYVLARRLLNEGAIGRLRKVYLVHSGYRHHAIAGLKQLTGAQHPKRVSITRWSPWCADIHVALPGGVRAQIVEPRRYDSGATMIVGTRGFITDYPIDHPKVIRLGYLMEDGRYLGLTLGDDPVARTDLDEAFAKGLEGAPLEAPSLMNQMKIRGFMELLGGLADPASPFRYPAVEAIADDLVIRFAERSPFAVPGASSLLRPAARLTAPFMRSSGDEV